MTTAPALDKGRDSFARQEWRDAYAHLSAAIHEGPLELEDLERLAVAAYLVGRDDDSADIWALAHQECLRLGNMARAARCAFWLALGLLGRGEVARGGGWLARAGRLLEEAQLDCVERGYLLVPVALQCMAQGNTEAAYAAFDQASNIGDRFGEMDLTTLGRLGRGQALLQLGKIRDGVALLDEVMVAVTSGEVSPAVAGIAYCAVIEACHEIFDLRRAQEWTEALTHWCESQPDLVPYRGQCLVHRAQIMQSHGAWLDAMDEAQRACEWLSGHPAIGAAFYQQAELYRLRGEFLKAEEAYRQANKRGRTPQPGLARLRLAQGRMKAAVAAIRRVVGELQYRTTHPPRWYSSTIPEVLATYVEIMLAAGDVDAARAAANELSKTTSGLNAPVLDAVAAQAQGAVTLVQGDARSALETLRRAWMVWQDFDVPYEAARVRVLIGLAYRDLEDEDTASMELNAAHWAFEKLGAAPDVARVEALFRKTAPKAAGGLSSRQVEVLILLAAGKTNRAIAADLFLSEKTVARHVSNIFTKLGLSSRAAATAYAYQHDLM
jgi:DNA-binding CsgD family transcriptional regulator